MFKEVFAFTDSISNLQRKYDNQTVSNNIKANESERTLLDKLSDSENKTKQMNTFLRPPKMKSKHRKQIKNNQSEKIALLLSKMETFRAQTESELFQVQVALADSRKNLEKLSVLKPKSDKKSSKRMSLINLQIFKLNSKTFNQTTTFVSQTVQTLRQNQQNVIIDQSETMLPIFYQPSVKDLRFPAKNLCLLKKRRVIFCNFTTLCQSKPKERKSGVNLSLELPETLFQTSSFIPILSPVANVMNPIARELSISSPRKIFQRSLVSQSTITACYSSSSDTMNSLQKSIVCKRCQNQTSNSNDKLSAAQIKCAKLTATIGVLMANFQSKQTSLQKKIEAKKVDQDMHSAILETNKRLLYKVEILETKLEFFQFNDIKSQKVMYESFEKINFELGAQAVELRTKLSKKKHKIETLKTAAVVERKKFERLIELTLVLWTEFFRQSPQQITELCDSDIKMDEFNLKIEQLEDSAKSVMKDVLELKNYDTVSQSNQTSECKEVMLNTLLAEFLHRLDGVVAQEVKLKQILSEQVI